MSAQRAHRRHRKAVAQRSYSVLPEPAFALAPEQAFAIPAPDTDKPASPSPSATRAGVAARASLTSLRGVARRTGAWLRARTWEQWAWTAVLTLATILRFWDLGAKALHHDESMHAFYSLLFARDPSSYAYNPLLHGPFQFHAEGFMFMLILAAQALFHVGGPGDAPWINDTTARIVPALFGIGIVALPLGLRRELTRVGALIAALLLAVSPSFVYFSRFLREDIYFNFFMFAMVVCAVRFATSRRMLWLALTAAATILAYSTFEGIFLTLAIFVSFLIVALVWEIAVSVSHRFSLTYPEPQNLLLIRAILLVATAGLGGIIAIWALHTMRKLSDYITMHPAQADYQVATLEQRTVTVLLYASIAIALAVIITLIWQIARDNAAYAHAERMAAQAEMADGDEEPLPEMPLTWRERAEAIISAPGRFAALTHERLDEERQPLLRLLLGISWAQWFVAFVTGWMLFVAMYWELPGAGRTLGQGFEEGIGHGVWHGLYYWLQQQDVARGAQPVYYYFLLIPLYEQLAVVLGLAGVVYAIVRPTRFRVFLVWWFIGSLGIYSWAGEKMPWLSIHILLPLMLLAAIAINRALQGAWGYLRELRRGIPNREALTWRSGGAVAGVVLAVLLLIPMVHSMYLLTYRDPANGPLEMMVYVQTTQDVDTVMAKIAKADQHLYGGKHQLKIVVGQGEEWPMYWYLRDYWLDPHPGSYVTWDPQPVNGANPFANMNPDALILYPGDQVQQFFQAHPTGYHMKEYALRSWFDESYKPQLPCLQKPGLKCPSDVNYALYGQGLGPWLTYGSKPPANATFNLVKASSRLWNWLWVREPLGSTTGPYYDFVFIVRDSAGVKP
jgi:uncharacterized protein (TIGR03663 family)